jgi:kynurenine formamidase
METDRDIDALKRIAESLRELNVDERLSRQIDRFLQRRQEDIEEEDEEFDIQERDDAREDDDDNEDGAEEQEDADESDENEEESDKYLHRKDRHGHSREVIDLSVLSAPSLPCTWPSTFLPPLVLMHYLQHGPGPYASEALVIDEHTGTHWDAPAHFIPPPSTGLANAADIGNVSSERVPIWQFVGEGCVIDVQSVAIGPNPGESGRIVTKLIQDWEKSNRSLQAGDIVLLYTGYSDQFYGPLPGGRRYVADPIGGKAPGYPGVDPACMLYMAGKEVSFVGIDSPNIGPVGPDAIATHVNALKNGVLIMENLINLKHLPKTGSFVAVLGPKHAAASGGEARVIAVKEPKVAQRLIKSARLQRVADLSVLLREDLPVSWPGAGVANNRTPYLSRTLHNWDQPGGPALVRAHMLDVHSGTHLVPPAYAVPTRGFDREDYDDTTRRLLDKFEDKYGRIGSSEVTADKVPLGDLLGPAHVIDVTSLVGTAAPGKSPAIRKEHIHDHERAHREIERGDVVIFHSGHSDRFFQPFPYGSRCIADALNGIAEGWPAPTPETIIYLAKKGVRCIGTDGPSIGSAEPELALMTYWAGGKHGVNFIEYLTNVGVLPRVGSYFVFSPVKVRGLHGGYGRALALF